MRNDDTKEKIRRLREPCDSTYDVMLAFMGWDSTDGSRDCRSFQIALIDLLKDSDPSYWDTKLLEEEYGLIPLPRDKDGEVIRVGNIVWSVDSGEQMMVTQILNGGSEGTAIRAIEHDYSTVYAPCDVTHRPPVTVESVLREFAKESSSIDMCGEFDVLVAEYATKLRLAKEGE